MQGLRSAAAAWMEAQSGQAIGTLFPQGLPGRGCPHLRSDQDGPQGRGPQQTAPWGWAEARHQGGACPGAPARSDAHTAPCDRCTRARYGAPGPRGEPLGPGTRTGGLLSCGGRVWRSLLPPCVPVATAPAPHSSQGQFRDTARHFHQNRRLHHSEYRPRLRAATSPP